MGSAIVALRRVRKELGLSREVRQIIIPDLSLEVERGEFVAITGPSGSGKSTLLYLLGGLDRPDGGEVWFDGDELTALPERALNRVRNEKIGFIYQFHFLLPEFSALENVSMPMMIKGSLSRQQIRERAMMLLELVEMHQKASNRPNQLSGGQQQRVAIARALANEPKVLLGDEPTGNLDSRSANNVYGLFDRLNRELRQTIIVVTHDEGFANRAGRRVHIVDGRVASDRRGADVQAAAPSGAGGVSSGGSM